MASPATVRRCRIGLYLRSSDRRFLPPAVPILGPGARDHIWYRVSPETGSFRWSCRIAPESERVVRLGGGTRQAQCGLYQVGSSGPDRPKPAPDGGATGI